MKLREEIERQKLKDKNLLQIAVNYDTPVTLLDPQKCDDYIFSTDTEQNEKKCKKQLFEHSKKSEDKSINGFLKVAVRTSKM